MLEILKNDNITKLWDKYWSGSYSIYELLVGKSDRVLGDEERDNLRNFINDCAQRPEDFMSGVNPMTIIPGQEMFCHIASNNFPTRDVGHRLYFNLEMCDRTHVASVFMSKCKERGIPYYVKLSNENNRNDNMVVYVTDEHIEITKQIFDEMIIEMPMLKYCFGTLPLTVEKVGYYGYGVEEKGNSKHSFSSRVAGAISRGFVLTLNEFREIINMECPSRVFGEKLLSAGVEHKALEVYERTKDAQLFSEVMEDKDDEYYKGFFESNAIRLAKDILGDKGFGGKLEGDNANNDSIDRDLPILEVKNPITRGKIALHPSDIMAVLRQTCSLQFKSGEQSKGFEELLVRNVKYYLEKDNLLDIPVPECLTSDVVM